MKTKVVTSILISVIAFSSIFALAETATRTREVYVTNKPSTVPNWTIGVSWDTLFFKNSLNDFERTNLWGVSILKDLERDLLVAQSYLLTQGVEVRFRSAPDANAKAVHANLHKDQYFFDVLYNVRFVGGFPVTGQPATKPISLAVGGSYSQEHTHGQVGPEATKDEYDFDFAGLVKLQLNLPVVNGIEGYAHFDRSISFSSSKEDYVYGLGLSYGI